MVTKKALILLRRLEIAVNAESEAVALAIEKCLHDELGLRPKLKNLTPDSRIA